MPAQHKMAFKRRVFLEYALTESATGVCREFGLNRSTLGRWRKANWWLDLEKELSEERALNPSAQALAERLDAIAKKMVKRFEEPGIIHRLEPKELAVTLERTIRARDLERGDEESLRKQMEGMETDELDNLINQLNEEIHEQEEAFGESSHKPKENDGKPAEIKPPSGSEDSDGTGAGSEAP